MVLEFGRFTMVEHMMHFLTSVFVHSQFERERTHARPSFLYRTSRTQPVSVTYLDLLLLHLKISRRCLPLHAHLPSEKQVKRLEMINEM